MAAATYNPLNEDSHNSPYGTNEPRYNASTGYIAPAPSPRKKGLSNWIKFGLPVLVVVIIAAVVAGVVATRHHNKDASSSSGSSSGSGSPGDTASASAVASAKLAVGRFATATDSEFMVPVYPSTVSMAFFSCCVWSICLWQECEC